MFHENSGHQRWAARCGFDITALYRIPLPFTRELPRVHSDAPDLVGLTAHSYRQLREWLDTVANVRVHGTTERVVAQHFIEERAAFQALPAVQWCVPPQTGCQTGSRVRQRKLLQRA